MVLWQVVVNFFQSGPIQASALAYYAVFSIFPLILLIAVLVSNIAGPAVARDQIASGLALFLPQSSIDAIREVLALALNQSAEFGVIALIGLVWSATGLFASVTDALDGSFHATQGRSLWQARLLALFMGMILVFLVLASFITSGVLRLILALSFETNNFITLGLSFVPLGLNLVIFALLFRFIPARIVSWDAIWPSALVGALGWELAKSAFEWYLTNLASYSIIYGSIATAIVLLFWAYLMASIFLLAAELCARLNEWFEAQNMPHPPLEIMLDASTKAHTAPSNSKDFRL